MAHHVILVPPLKIGSKPFESWTRSWLPKYGLTMHVMNVWETENDFYDMLKKVIEQIDELAQHGDDVSLVGASGGGSLIMNAFSERLLKVNKAINVCGRLRIGMKDDLEHQTTDKQLKAYNESIARLEARKNMFSSADRRRIMTVRPMFGQEFVPKDTVQLDGAMNIEIPTIEHILSIVASLTVFSKRLADFINRQKR